MDDYGWSQPIHDPYGRFALGGYGFASTPPTLITNHALTTSNSSASNAVLTVQVSGSYDTLETGGGGRERPEHELLSLLWVLLPISLALLTLLYDACTSSFFLRRTPKVVLRVVNVLRSPFTDFLQLEDLHDELGPTNLLLEKDDVARRWKRKTRVCLGLVGVQAAAWAGVAVWRVVQNTGSSIDTSTTMGVWTDGRVQAAGQVVAWVSICILSSCHSPFRILCCVLLGCRNTETASSDLLMGFFVLRHSVTLPCRCTLSCDYC